MSILHIQAFGFFQVVVVVAVVAVNVRVKIPVSGDVVFISPNCKV